MMDVNEVKKRWRGAFIPVLTIYNEDLSVNIDAINTNIQHLFESGAEVGNTVLLICGAGGDFPMLSVEERKEIAAGVVDYVEERLPVIIGVQDTNPRVVKELAVHAQDCGAEGIQVSPPYYYPPTQEDIYAFFQDVNDAISIPIMAYNTYWEYVEGVQMQPQLIERLCGLENVVCLKWSAAGLGEYQRGYQFADRLAIVDNNGSHIYNHMQDGVGYITHLASPWPRHEFRVWKELERGNYTRAQEIIWDVNMLWKEFRGRVAQKTNGEAVAIKAAMEEVGLEGGPSRSPSRDEVVGDEEIAILREVKKRIQKYA